MLLSSLQTFYCGLFYGAFRVLRFINLLIVHPTPCVVNVIKYMEDDFKHSCGGTFC